MLNGSIHVFLGDASLGVVWVDKPEGLGFSPFYTPVLEGVLVDVGDLDVVATRRGEGPQASQERGLGTAELHTKEEVDRERSFGKAPGLG